MPARVRRLARRSASPCPRQGDGGFTLIEVMVAMVIVMIVLLAVGAGIAANLSGSKKAGEVDASVQVARDAIENVETGGWSTIGFYKGDAGYTKLGRNGEYTVSLGTTAPDPRPATLPLPSTQTTTIGIYKIKYRVEITWANQTQIASVTASNPVYSAKRITVYVGESGSGATYKNLVQQSTLVAPEPDEAVPPGVANPPACNPSITVSAICAATVTSGAVHNGGVTAPFTNDVPITFTMTATLDAARVNVNYYASEGNQKNILLTNTTGRTWSGTLPVGTSIMAGQSRVQFTLTGTGNVKAIWSVMATWTSTKAFGQKLQIASPWGGTYYGNAPIVTSTRTTAAAPAASDTYTPGTSSVCYNPATRALNSYTALVFDVVNYDPQDGWANSITNPTVTMSDGSSGDGPVIVPPTPVTKHPQAALTGTGSYDPATGAYGSAYSTTPGVMQTIRWAYIMPAGTPVFVNAAAATSTITLTVSVSRPADNDTLARSWNLVLKPC